MTHQIPNQFYYRGERCYSLLDRHNKESELVPKAIIDQLHDSYEMKFVHSGDECAELHRKWIAKFETFDNLILSELWVMRRDKYPQINGVNAIVDPPILPGLFGLSGATYALNCPIKWTGVLELAKYGTKDFFAKVTFFEGRVIEEIVRDDTAIGALAEELWRQRGCPIGSPETDWQEAERQLGWDYNYKYTNDSSTVNAINDLSEPDIAEAKRLLELIETKGLLGK